jgi:two-component SAPR family response regulator
VSFSHKAQKRPLDLLKVLIALGGRQVSQTRILEELWPHGKAAPASFDMALKRLRDLLGADALVRTERKLTLNRAHCWVDVWALERALKLGADDASRESAALYKGPFLRGETDVWCLPTRERVRAAFVRHVHRAAQALARAGRWAEAADWYADGLNADDLAEPFYRELMRCYVALDRRAEALGVFRRCCRVLDAQLGIAPSAATVTLSRSIAD